MDGNGQGFCSDTSIHGGEARETFRTIISD